MFGNQKTSVILLSVVIIIGSLFYSFRNTDIALKDKPSLLIILSDKPISHHFRTSLKFYDDIQIKAIGYRNTFIIKNFEYKASYYDRIINELDKGDTIQVWVNGNLEKENNISVYGLQYKHFDYINVKERNSIKSRYNKYGLIVTLYGVFLLFILYIKQGFKLTFGKAIIVLFIILIGIYRITK